MNTREMAEEYRRSHWTEIMRERRESGLSIRGYCRERGIHENVYYYWQKKLRTAACGQLASNQAARDKSALSAPGFVEVQLAQTPVPHFADAAAELQIEVGGVRITAGRGYPAEELARLLRELMKPC